MQSRVCSTIGLSYLACFLNLNKIKWKNLTTVWKIYTFSLSLERVSDFKGIEIGEKVNFVSIFMNKLYYLHL